MACLIPEAEMTQAERTAETTSAIRKIQWFTVLWMTTEAVIALLTAVRARSVALLAFGSDSAIELLSASVVLWRFSSRR